MSVAVSKILKYLSYNNMNIMMKQENSDSATRAKKRRLDHLTWEEKLQRKKLKNRVAAQTSRDRKKAKMEEMEQAVQELFLKNESLLDECKDLRDANKRLTEENAELRRKCSQNRSVECEVQQGSTEGTGHILSSGFEDANYHGSVEDCIGLPSLPDLLDELDRDVDFDSLEKLTESLLQDIAADMEAAAEKTNCQESNVGGQDGRQQVVGSPSEDLEPSRCKSLDADGGLEQEISPFLLLHHNYSAKQDSQPQRHAKCRKTKIAQLNTKTKLKSIMPKSSTETFLLDTNSKDVLYGTLDESANCITIIVNGDDLPLSEAVTEVTTTEEIENDPSDMDLLEVPSLNVLSPSNSYSDCGYESFDSPHSVDEQDTNIWDQSVSELFPMLL